MPELTLDLKYLKYATYVAEEGSFRRAADKLSLSQSTITRRVQLLERQLGIALFERTRTGSRLTPEGQRFLRQAAIGARYIREAASEIHSGRGGSGVVKIGILASFSIDAVRTLLGCFRERFPAIDVKLEEATSDSNASAVRRGRLDAAILLGCPDIPGLSFRHVSTDALYVALPPPHALARRERLSWEDLKDEVFLATSDGAGSEAEEYLRRLLPGMNGRLRLSIQQVGRETLLTMVAQDFGVALTTASARDDVVFVPLGSADTELCSSLVWSPENANPALERLLEIKTPSRPSLGLGKSN